MWQFRKWNMKYSHMQMSHKYSDIWKFSQGNAERGTWDHIKLWFFARTESKTDNSTYNDIEKCNLRIFTVSSQHRLSPIHTHSQGASICKSHTTHQALTKCNMSRVIWCVRTAQLSILTELKLHLYLDLFHWLKSVTSEGREETRVPGHPPPPPPHPPRWAPGNATYSSPKLPSPDRDSNPHTSTGGKHLQGKLMC